VLILFVTIFSFEGAQAVYDNHGSPGNLWVTGTHIYGIVVIMTNVKIFWSTNNHTIFSVLITLASIASFYIVVFLMS
jgi:hypothetical protein